MVLVPIDGRSEYVLVPQDEVGRVSHARRRGLAGDLGGVPHHTHHASFAHLNYEMYRL